MINSTSNERVLNNVVRHEYRVLNDHEKAQMKAIKDAGLDFITLLEELEDVKTRETALAITKIEEAVMWAVRGLTR